MIYSGCNLVEPENLTFALDFLNIFFNQENPLYPLYCTDIQNLHQACLTAQKFDHLLSIDAAPDCYNRPDSMNFTRVLLDAVFSTTLVFL